MNNKLNEEINSPATFYQEGEFAKIAHIVNGTNTAAAYLRMASEGIRRYDIRKEIKDITNDFALGLISLESQRYNN